MEWISYNTREPQSRSKPADLISNMTPQTKTYWLKRETGIGPWVETGASHDYDCYSWGNWFLSKKRYSRATYLPSIELTNLPQLSYPSWATPLRLAIKDDVINLGATLAEYRQSVHMFGSAARGVVDAFRAIRKLKFMKRRSLCSVTNAHLIHDYGIAPLMSDMYDSWEALRLRLEQPIFKTIYMGLHPKTVKGERTSTWTTRGGEVESYEERKGKQQVKAYVELDREKASMFTIGNPLELAWEVTPFSFVVDWFVPIGDTLIALDAMKAVKEIHICVTRKEEEHAIHYLYDYDRHGNRSAGSKPGILSRKYHERLIYNSVPLPSFPKPSWNNSVSTLFNAVSLLVSVRGCKGAMPRWKKSDLRHTYRNVPK